MTWTRKPVLTNTNPNPDGESETSTISKPQLNHKVVLYNDEQHTYDYVVEMLTDVCKLARDAAFRCAVEVDMTGRTIVYYGEEDDCQLVQAKICSYGADHRIPESMTSMDAEVQAH